MTEKASPFVAISDEERLELLNAELHRARKSRFYAEYLPEGLNSLDELAALPRTSARDIEERGSAMVCVPGSEVARIVTLHTSGTLGKPKRVYFTRNDLERTVTFFDEGMRWMCGKGDGVGIFMPCSSPDGLGDLLYRGLERIGAVPLKYGMVSRASDFARRFLDERPRVVVGLPWQMRLLALACPEASVGVVLLSADYVPNSCREFFRSIWGAEVLNHYGMTETGLGGAVESLGHDGMYIRRDELLFEVTDPNTGRPVPEGEDGEIVITTLRREAMPLIRYRTGDIGQMEGGRLMRVTSRLNSPLPIESGGRQCTLLEEEFFPEKRLFDYQIGWKNAENRLCITAFWQKGQNGAEKIIKTAVTRVFGEKISAGLELNVVPTEISDARCAYIAKRVPVIMD